MSDRCLPARYGDGLSLRQFARRMLTSKSALSRSANELDRDLDKIERLALESLEQRFISNGHYDELFTRYEEIS
jgi:transcriptional regulator with XRE-family HTH domain